ncbi:hypothetical protein B4135_3516 [Caldibacillus debilis]|uniref:Uncharacterized protein n=1 Tax=Caldibacillus debilis TaxID=301148 RepID=A0A150LDD1_9BACI|nr:hypothetical protein B4135_3516 [Caldibacillus debilis]
MNRESGLGKKYAASCSRCTAETDRAKNAPHLAPGAPRKRIGQKMRRILLQVHRGNGSGEKCAASSHPLQF